jgi:AraC-like DNA-binding protein
MGHIADYIDAHLHRFVSLDELALLPGLSPSHFAKKFHQSAGLSVQRFVNRRRLQAALPMLETTSTPLSQVSLALGFSSQSHFTRLFGEMTGMTPDRFRKQIGRASQSS